MTVHPTVDHADVWAAHKQPKADQDPMEQLGQLSLLDRQCFQLLDDLQIICHRGCNLDSAAIGSIQAKLIILRINLNIRHGIDTPQLGGCWAGIELAEVLGQR